jgi:hypothetical protein
MFRYATGIVLFSLDRMSEKRAIRKLLDPAFYLRANPDVAAAQMDPLEHYVKYGAREQRQPHPLFEPAHYQASCPEARNAPNPLLHFLGQNNRWANPHPLFDCEAYRNAHPEAAGNPLVDYVSRRAHEDVHKEDIHKDATTVRFVLLHYHFFKNAGTTVEEILAHSFFENYGRFDTQDFDGAVGPAELISYLRRHPRMKAISSHQFRYPLPEARGFVFFDLCFLRDPLDRIRSMYDYFREKPVPGEPASDLACDASMGGFISGLVEHHAYRVSNVQVNMLANGVVNDPPAEADLDRATKVMLQMSFLGVVDLFNESLIAGQHSLRPVFPSLALAQEPANVSSGLDAGMQSRMEKFRQACDPEVYAELVRLNALDRELLNRARAEVHRRFALGPEGTMRLRELQEQVSR